MPSHEKAPNLCRIAGAVWIALGAGCGDDSPPPSDAGDGGGDRDSGSVCLAGQDADRDQADDAQECELGLDPRNPDTDGDGLRDGVELAYPKLCLAYDPNRQRRDSTVACYADVECNPGERCQGLDPWREDTDGDGVTDSNEETTIDGEIKAGEGETDPRLADTDGDGTSDGAEGVYICRPEGLAHPSLDSVEGGTSQVAFEVGWGDRRAVTGDAVGFVFDAEDEEVAALALELAPVADLETALAQTESVIALALPGAVGVLVRRPFTSHDGYESATSFYRLSTAGVTAGSVRDTLGSVLAGGVVDEGDVVWRTAGTYYLEMTVQQRLNEADDPESTVILAAVAPAGRFDDATSGTAILVRDLTNATGIAASGRALDTGCQTWVTDRIARADFLWLVDVSGSMNADQENLGRVAGDFFEGLSTAGVDFRVGVFEATPYASDFEAWSHCTIGATGFSFIDATDAASIRDLQYQVTKSAYLSAADDYCHPYGPAVPNDQSEQPVAAGVAVIEEFDARAEAGETVPDFRLRDGAQVVAFFVTDESGISNDDGRYFALDTARWGITGPGRVVSATDFYTTRDVLTFGLVYDHATVCPTVDDFSRCVILGGGGAYIPIATAEEEEVAVAMDRIVEAVAGAASTYVLESVPISSTIRVTVDGAEVPRSRSEGFDYDGASNSVLFRGALHRPEIGSEVVVSYRAWGAGVG